MTDDYRPFPEEELQKLAAFHDAAAANFPERGYLHSLHTERAATCREALKSFAALRERCLVAEMELGQAQRKAS